MSPTTHIPDVLYRNLLDDCRFETDKPVIDTLAAPGDTQVKRVALKAGTRLECHKTADHVLVLWVHGKARFTANDAEYAMHPGAMLKMRAGTPHGAVAETDCVFAVFKFKKPPV